MTTKSRTRREAALRIRRAQLDDMTHVVNILRSSASWYKPFVDSEDMDQHEVGPAWARENFEKRDFFVGELDDEVVGTVTLQDAGRDAYVGYVYLHADHTGKGLGRELLDHARDESARRGHEGMVLIAHPKADWATRAYERYGFKRIAESKRDVLAWNNQYMKPFYEEGFHLFRYAHP
ncbi:MAG: ribosomal protein S18 acetylase RimI-like enzyme [Myxococcota bacterium]|jgi:ribosomal protein S18 acetylase RimI-like enzyme